MRIIDLRSDTLTRPTPAMRQAMAEADDDAELRGIADRPGPVQLAIYVDGQYRATVSWNRSTAFRSTWSWRSSLWRKWA